MSGESNRVIRVGILGPGLMGAPMARNIRAAGHEVTVWARRPEAVAALATDGIASAETPAALAAASDVVISMLPDLPQLEPLLDGPDGVYAGVDGSVVLVVASTVSPAGVRDFGARVAEASSGAIAVIDAPVSGGEKGAIAGELSLMVGGDESAVATAWPVLSACGTPTHLGAIGAGSVVKAANQLIVGAEVAALSEASLLARDAGIELSTLFDVLSRGLASSEVLNQKRARLTEADYTVSGAAKFMAKDLRFVLEAAGSTGTPAPLATFLRGQYEGLNEAGLGDLDIIVMQKYVDEHLRGE